MAKDVLITPLDGLIQFSSSAGSGSGQIKVDGDDLVVSNLIGDVLLGDGASDIFIGDGTNNVDIVFEQNGEIRDDGTGKNIIFGSKTTNVFVSGSNTVALQSGGGNVGIGKSTATKTLEITGDISASGNLHIDGNLLASGSLRFPTPASSQGDGIIFFDTSSNAPNTNVNAIQWDFSNDDAFIYAVQSASDTTYLVNELRDNVVTDKFVWWFNNFAGATTDSFPLMLEGNKAVVNYIKDKNATFHRDSGATNGAANNVDFYLLKSGSTSVSTANSLIHGDVSVGKTTLNDIVLVDGNLTASGDISASGTSHTFGGDLTVTDDITITRNSLTIDGDNGGGITMKANEPIINLNPGGSATARIGYTGNSIRLNNSSLSFSTVGHLVVSSSGLTTADALVGIGTLNPTKALQVTGDISASHTGSFGTVTIGTLTPENDSTALTVNGGASGKHLAYFERTIGSTGAFISINANASDPQVRFYANNSNRQACIGVDNDNGNFVIANGSAISGNEAMVMEFSTGNFGIGTTGPNNPLSVSGSLTVFNSNNTSRLTVGEADDSGVTTNNSMIIETDGANNKSHTFTVGTGNDYVIEALGNKSDIHLSAFSGVKFGVNNGTAFNFTEQMILTGSTGNLGIGTSTPSEKLTVEGNISASGHITASNLIVKASNGNFTLGDIPNAGLAGVHSSADLTLAAVDDLFFAGGSSGNVIATIEGDENQFTINSSFQANGGITASGDISASGDLYLQGNDIYNDGTQKIRFGSNLQLYTSNGEFIFNNTDTSIASGDTYARLSFLNSDCGEETAHIQIVATEAHNGSDNGGSKYEFKAFANAVDTSDTENFSTIATLDPNGTSGHLNVNGDISSSGGFFVSSSGNVMINSDNTGSMTTHKGVFSVNYGTGIELTGSLTSTGDGFGKVVKFGGTTGMSVGRVYHLNTSGGWTLAGETGAVSSSLLAVALGTNSDIDGMLLEGFVKGAVNGTPVVGQASFLDGAGRFTPTAPSDAGDVVRIVGYAVQTGLSNAHFYFNPDNTFVEVSS